MGRTLWKTNIGLLIAAAILVNLTWTVKSSPIPDSTHIGHSLASFATTNSFLYSNKIGAFNYRFTKPNLAFTKFVGFPQQQSISNLGGHTFQLPVFTNSGSNDDVISLGKSLQSGDVKISSNDRSTLSTTPAPSPALPAYSLDLHPGDIESDSEGAKDFDEFLTTPEDKGYDSFSNKEVPKVAEKETNDKPVDSTFDLENLVNKVINAPIRRVGVSSTSGANINNAPTVDGTSSENFPQNRQDSNLEQPIPFFPPGSTQRPSSQGIYQEPKPSPQQLPLPGLGNYRFSLPSTSQHSQQPFSGLFSGVNRFSLSQNGLFQTPSHQSSLSTPQSPYNSNGFTTPTVPPSNQPFNLPNSPFQSASPFPRSNAGPAAGPPPPPPGPEPENGFNPFHLHENYPEPPYESEFANYPSLAEDDVEQSARSAGNNNAHRPLLDFAQETLRNLRTEELLEVVQRKQVPPDCVYNTISYGANGEDCIQARKKRQV